MRSRRPRALRRALLVAAVAGTAVVAAPALASGEGDGPLLEGLDAARAVDVGPGGRVIVAEAGDGSVAEVVEHLERGGAGASVVLAELPSAGGEQGVSGPSGVALEGADRLYVTYGAGAEGVPANQLLRIQPWGEVQLVADLGAYQQADPDPYDLEDDPTESNAYDVELLPGGQGVLVADAAGNDLLWVRPEGQVTTVACFAPVEVSTDHVPAGAGLPPSMSAEAVPTSVAVGPDGAWYVGLLRGFPFRPGTSEVWRVPAGSQGLGCDPEVGESPGELFAGDFTAVVDVAFDHDGRLYVLELSRDGVAALEEAEDPSVLEGTGRLWQVTGDDRVELAAGQLTAPGGVAADRTSAYVTNLSLVPGASQLLAVPLGPAA